VLAAGVFPAMIEAIWNSFSADTNTQPESECKEDNGKLTIGVWESRRYPLVAFACQTADYFLFCAVNSVPPSLLWWSGAFL